MKDQMLYALKDVVMMYRPVRGDRQGNFLSVVSLLIGLPLLFLMPLLICTRTLLLVRNGWALLPVLFAIVNLILSPVIVAYALVLPFLGRRLFMFSPAADALQALRKELSAQNEGAAG